MFIKPTLEVLEDRTMPSGFGVLPPEINSGVVFHAAAWDGLAAELNAASSYEAIISGLSAGAWSGPASVAMVNSAAPYASWLTASAAQAEAAVSQSLAAASSYESAFERQFTLR